jgi:hypothetical protein
LSLAISSDERILTPLEAVPATKRQPNPADVVDAANDLDEARVGRRTGTSAAAILARPTG